MADTVTSQTLHDGNRNVVMKFTNASDGSGETTVKKVDVSALTPAPSKVRIMRIHYTTDGMGVNVIWDADTNVLAAAIPANASDTLDFTCFGGLINNAGTGVTGDILFSTTNAASGDGYMVVLEMVKT